MIEATSDEGDRPVGKTPRKRLALKKKESVCQLIFIENILSHLPKSWTLTSFKKGAGQARDRAP